MTQLRDVGILATGSYVPEKILTNADFERMVDTSDEWITSRTGITERHVASEGETTVTFAVGAARKALERARISAEDVDLILVATVTGDMIFPSTSCLVQAEIGAVNAGCMDVQAACSGFLYALSVGQQYVSTGQAHNVLVIGAETLTRITDYEDRSSCILFGDGAGCVILSPDFERGQVLPGRLHADGKRGDVIQVKAGGTRYPTTKESLERREQFMVLRGREVYKFAVARFVDLVKKQLEVNPDHELGLVIPHQVNQRIIESARAKLDLPEDMVYTNIARFGNTSAASIPLAFDEVVSQGMLDDKKGKLVVFCAFGAGLTWASGAVVW